MDSTIIKGSFLILMQAANGDSLKRNIVVTNPHGFHMRPIVIFVETASKFQSSVFVYRPGDEKVNGKSAMKLLTLAAEPGTELTLEVDGPDASAALEALTEAILTIPPDE